MLIELYRIGDRVVMAMDEEARAWGRKGVADGTIGTIVGRHRYERHNGYEEQWLGDKPGVVSLNGVPIILWDHDGPERPASIDDFDSTRVGGSDMRLLDEAEAAARQQAFRDLTQDERNAFIAQVHDEHWERDLPDTKVLPLDRVRIIGSTNDDHQHMIVTRISYNVPRETGMVHCLDLAYYDPETGEKRNWGTLIGYTDEQVEVIGRGNHWRERAGEPLIFRDLADRAAWEKIKGRVHEVRNPSCDMYCWTKDEALDAIRTGIADGLSVVEGVFGSGLHNRVDRFDDREIGEQVRRATIEGFWIEGFGLVPV